MLALSLLLAASVVGETPGKAVAPDDFVGRWNVRITDADDTFIGGWIKVEKKDGGLAGSVVWRWGSALPTTKTELERGTLRLVSESEPGKPDVFEAHLEGAVLKGNVRYADGKVHHFEGKRAPELTAASGPRWAPPVTLFDGKTLQGWRLREPKAKMGWAVVNGELAVVDPEGNADLITEKAFQDLKLHLEFNVDPRATAGSTSAADTRCRSSTTRRRRPSCMAAAPSTAVSPQE